MPKHAWDAHPWSWDEPPHVVQKPRSILYPGGASTPSTLSTNLAHIREVSVPQTAIAATAESHDYSPVCRSREEPCQWHT